MTFNQEFAIHQAIRKYISFQIRKEFPNQFHLVENNVAYYALNFKFDEIMNIVRDEIKHQSVSLK